MLISLIVTIISQCIHISKYHVVHLKKHTLIVQHTSVKLRNKEGGKDTSKIVFPIFFNKYFQRKNFLESFCRGMYFFSFNSVISLWMYHVCEADYLTDLFTYHNGAKDASMLELKKLALNFHNKTKATRKQHQQNIQK